MAARRVFSPELVNSQNPALISASPGASDGPESVNRPISMTTVYSPRGSPMAPRTSEIGPLTNCSWTFVSSRPTTTKQSPRDWRRSWSVCRIRCGASKNTTVRPADRTSDSHFSRSDDLIGGNPRNVNVSVGRPDPARAASAALGPGMGSTRMPASMALRISCRPGSEIVGVPASETRAIESPRCRRSTRAADFLFSLCSWRLVVGVVIEKRERS